MTVLPIDLQHLLERSETYVRKGIASDGTIYPTLFLNHKEKKETIIIPMNRVAGWRGDVIPEEAKNMFSTLGRQAATLSNIAILAIEAWYSTNTKIRPADDPKKLEIVQLGWEYQEGDHTRHGIKSWKLERPMDSAPYLGEIVDDREFPSELKPIGRLCNWLGEKKILKNDEIETIRSLLLED